MTDIAVHSTPFQPEDLSWDLSRPDVPHVGSDTLDVSLFTQAQHFPNGYIPSGTVLARKTSTNLLGPYLDSANDGTQTAVGILRASIAAVLPNGQVKAKVGVPVLAAFGVIKISRLPFTSSNAANGGFLDADAQADLPHLHFVA